MFIAMFKKELKQFVRSKGNVLLLFVFPIALITTLAVGLNSMMTSGSDFFADGDEPSKVYYTIEGKDNKYKEGFEEFTSGIEDELKVKFEEISSKEDAEEDVDTEKALLHINIDSEGFEIYTSKNGEGIRSKIMRSLFESFLNQYAVYDTIGELNPEAFKNLAISQYDEYVTEEKLDGKESVSSAEYYTFAELALIILYISVTVGESVYKESQLKTINRIRLSKIKESVMIAAKVAFGICIGILQTLVVYAYSSIVLNVDWGQNTLEFISLFIVFSIFGSVVGVIIGLLAKKDNTVSSVLNIVIIFICALGGCYTPMAMLVSVPVLNKLIFISPIYWINTATSSMICGYESSAYFISVAIPIILSAVCVLAYAVIMKKKGGLQSV